MSAAQPAAIVAPASGIAPITFQDDKPAIEHEEARKGGDHFDTHDAANIGTASRYAELSLKTTLRSFPMATTYALLAAFNALNDGYCYSIPGRCIDRHIESDAD